MDTPDGCCQVPRSAANLVEGMWIHWKKKMIDRWGKVSVCMWCFNMIQYVWCIYIYIFTGYTLIYCILFIDGLDGDVYPFKVFVKSTKSMWGECNVGGLRDLGLNPCHVWSSSWIPQIGILTHHDDQCDQWWWTLPRTMPCFSYVFFLHSLSVHNFNTYMIIHVYVFIFRRIFAFFPLLWETFFLAYVFA